MVLELMLNTVTRVVSLPEQIFKFRGMPALMLSLFPCANRFTGKVMNPKLKKNQNNRFPTTRSNVGFSFKKTQMKK
jgi:hypothetical protein